MSQNTFEFFCRNFSQLTKQEIYDLYNRYKLDFELYGYSPDEYIAMGMDANKP